MNPDTEQAGPRADSGAALRERAGEAFAAGNLEASLAALEALAEAEPGDARTANDQAVVLFALGRHAESIAAFRHAQALAGCEGHLLVDNLLDALQAVALAPKPRREPAPSAAPAKDVPDDPASILGARRLWEQDSARALFRDLQAVDDETWFAALRASVDGTPFLGHALPGFIDPARQRAFVGGSGKSALAEAERFMRIVLGYCRQAGLDLGGDVAAADFGSGWGRYTRFLMKYVDPDKLYGLEVDPGMVEHCRRAFGTASFLRVDPMPPCPLRDGLLDLVIGYSVFSHLSRDCADAWIGEFGRIVKPGGLVIVTTQGRDFLRFCRSLRDRTEFSHPWHAMLAESFGRDEDALPAYDAGEFRFHGLGAYDGTYGDAAIPRAYVERHWLGEFELLDFFEDAARLPQAVIVLRRRATRRPQGPRAQPEDTRMDPTSASLRQDADACFREGRCDAAIAPLEQLVAREPGDAQAANDLAVVRFASGDAAGAVQAFREARRRAGAEDDVLVGNLIDALEALSDRLQRPPTPSEPVPRDAATLRFDGSFVRFDGVSLEMCVGDDLHRRSSTAETFVIGKTRSMIEGLLARIEGATDNILELGIWKGGSIVLLNEALAPRRLVGVDFAARIDPALLPYVQRQGGRLVMHPRTDQADHEALARILSTDFNDAPLDLVIDDASHFYEQSRASFEFLFPRLRPGGLYVIEDWGWAQWPGAHWQEEEGGDYFKGKAPLANLVIQLVLLSASRPDLVAAVEVNSVCTYVRRGAAAAGSPLDLDRAVLNRGRGVPRLP